MMNPQEKNIQVVKDMFAAVNKSDIPSLLNLLADNADWQSPVTNTVEEPVSWSKPRKNRNEVSAFYKEQMEKIKIDQWKANNFIAQNDIVVVDATLSGTVNSTGRQFSTNCLVMITIQNGKCVRYRNYYDSADLSNAFLMELRKAA